jgi:anti-sigma factor RsiW
MNGCCTVQARFTEYLDDRLNGSEMQRIAAHLDGCRECSREWESLRQTKTRLAGLGPAPEPEDLPLRIRVAVSQERAAAGFASAVLLLGTVIVLVTMFAQPEMAQATRDEPLGKATAPRLLYLSTGVGKNEIGTVSGPVVVEAYINGAGQVYDYRIVSGPTDEATRSQVENLLLFSVFEPARFFGQPVRGLAVLSFSGVSVRG